VHPNLHLLGARAVLTLTLAAFITGCGKKPAQTAVTPPPADTSAPPAAVAAETPAPAPTPFVAREVNPETVVADSQAALKSKDYETAAAVLLAAQQQKRLTDQQAMAVRNQMVALQRSLVSAVASGDPKAKAAADLLRASH
jgi:hypothetical protein